MEKLAADQTWHLFDPADTPTLIGAYGAPFGEAYEAYVASGVHVAAIPARRLWEYVCDAQTESGTPFILYQDNVNRKPNLSSDLPTAIH